MKREIRYTTVVFFCDNWPGDPETYDPEGPAYGWHYLTKKLVPVGPFATYAEAAYAADHDAPAPAVLGNVEPRMYRIS